MIHPPRRSEVISLNVQFTYYVCQTHTQSWEIQNGAKNCPSCNREGVRILDFLDFPNETFQFTLTAGQVTGMALVDGKHVHTLSIPGSATFSVGAGTVTESLTTPTGSATVNFAETSATSNLYTMSSETLNVANPTTTTPKGGTDGFSFTSDTTGAITGVTHTTTRGSHTFTDSWAPKATDQFSASGSSVTETRLQGDQVETLTYTQPSGSSLYALASEQITVIPTGGSATALNVNPCDQMQFTLSGGAVTAEARIGPNGTSHALSPSSGTTFTSLGSGYVEQVTTHGSHSSYTVFYAAPGASTYLEVAHGAGSTIDLAGLQAQIAQVPAALAGLI